MIAMLRFMEYLVSEKKLFYATEQQMTDIAGEFVDRYMEFVKSNPEYLSNLLINQGIQLKPKN